MICHYAFLLVLNQDKTFLLCSSFLLFVIYSLYSFLLFYLCCFAVRLYLDSQPNRILLVSIHHVLYPITVEVLHQVFSPHGIVEKIVTFQKSAGQHLQVSLSFSLSVYFLTCSWFVSCFGLRLFGIYGRIKRGMRISLLYPRTPIYGRKMILFFTLIILLFHGGYLSF